MFHNVALVIDLFLYNALHIYEQNKINILFKHRTLSLATRESQLRIRVRRL